MSSYFFSSISCTDVLIIFWYANGSDQTTSFWHSLLTNQFSSERVPNKNLWFLTILTRSYDLSWKTHAKCSDIIRVSIFRFIFLFTDSEVGLTTTEIELCHTFIIINDTKSSCWVNCTAIGIEETVLTCFFVSVAVDPFDSMYLVWFCRIFWRMICWLLDSTKPRLNCTKLITFTRRYFMENWWQNLIIRLRFVTGIDLSLCLQFFFFSSSLMKFIIVLKLFVFADHISNLNNFIFYFIS